MTILLEKNFLDKSVLRIVKIAIRKNSFLTPLILNKITEYSLGPEGDFNLEEIELAVQNNYQEISLSSERLRTETAAIVATHIVSLKQII